MLVDVTRQYCEPHRYYHNLEHIAHMFQLAKQWGVELSTIQTLAVWFHDVVYDPTRQDNEEQSARFMRKYAPKWSQVDVEKIILDTKTHKPSFDISKIVLDLDMAILGEQPLKYRRYAKMIRKEYIFVPEEMYQQARTGFLQQCLQDVENNELFFTDEAQSALNSNVPLNIKWELKQLKEGSL